MSDLPQLQDMLVTAAARRRRRGQLRGAGFAAAAVAAVAAVLAVTPSEEREAPVAATPHAAPRTVADAFGVFRRPARGKELVVDPAAGPRGGAPDPRLIGSSGRTDVFLVHADDHLCLMTTTLLNHGIGYGCSRASLYLDGKRPLGTFSDEDGPGTIALAFADGVREAALTLADGSSRTYPVTTNGFVHEIPSRPVRLEWRAPDGTRQSLDFHPTGQAGKLYAALRGDGPDALRSLPGSRALLSDARGSEAFLVPRRGAVCLVLRNGGREISGCRRDVTDLRHPLVVGLELDGGRRAVAAAAPDPVRRLKLSGPGGLTLSLPHALLAADDGRAGRVLSYRSAGKDRRLALPAGSFVLKARAEPPTAIPTP